MQAIALNAMHTPTLTARHRQHKATWLAITVRTLQTVLALMMVAMVAACGGGSDEPKVETLYVGFDYPAGTFNGRLFDTIQVTPIVTGVAGKQVSFKTSDVLPAGLSLNAGTGTISGVPTQTYQNPITVLMSVAGFEGFVSSSVQFDIRNPFSANYTVAPRLIRGVQRSIIPTLVGVAPGDVLSFAVMPADATHKGDLPVGLTLNTSTGEISGTPTELSDTSVGSLGHRVSIAMQVQRGSLVTASVVADLNLSVFAL